MSEKLRKIRRWQAELRALQQLAEITGPEAFVKSQLAGRTVPQGDVHQLVALVRKHCTQRPEGWQVNQRILATTLRNAGVLQPPPPVISQPAAASGKPSVQPVASTPALEPPAAPEPPRVEVRHIMILSSREARVLLGECKDGVLPDEFAPGARSRIGPEVWDLMKRQQVVITVGHGRGTMAAPSREMFDLVRFTVVDSRRARQDRWKNIPASKRYSRPSGGWYGELTSELARHPASGAGVAAATSSPRHPKPDLGRVIAVIEARIRDQRAAVTAIEVDLRPLTEKLLDAQEILAELEADLEAVKLFTQ